MSYFTDLSEGQKLTNVIVRDKVTTQDPLTGIPTTVFNEVLNTSTLVYLNSTAQTFVSDQYVKDVSATVLFDPTTPDFNNVTVSGEVEILNKKYTIIYIDNVSYQNELVVMPLKLKGARNAS